MTEHERGGREREREREGEREREETKLTERERGEIDEKKWRGGRGERARGIGAHGIRACLGSGQSRVVGVAGSWPGPRCPRAGTCTPGRGRVCRLPGL